MNISKSLYTRAIQCPKKYKSEVLTPADISTSAVFEIGNIVGEVSL